MEGDGGGAVLIGDDFAWIDDGLKQIVSAELVADGREIRAYGTTFAIVVVASGACGGVEKIAASLEIAAFESAGSLHGGDCGIHRPCFSRAFRRSDGEVEARLEILAGEIREGGALGFGDIGKGFIAGVSEVA